MGNIMDWRMFRLFMTPLAALCLVAGCQTVDSAPRSAPAALAAADCQTDLVELTKLDPSIKLDIKYATTDNFIGRKVYPEARAFLLRPAALSLAAASADLKKRGYGIVVFDAYRPWAITKIFWDLTPAEKRHFVADPQTGSIHNRGYAVDLSLYDLRTGQEIEMPSAFDEMNEKAYPDYSGGTAAARAYRDLLRAVMTRHDFTVHECEWWHFNYRGWEKQPVLNVPFSSIKN